MLLNAGPPSGPLHGSHYSAGHRWCGSTWLDVMDGGEVVMSETVPSPARSQPLNNYRRIVQPSLNKCSNVDTVEFRWESFKCILFSGTWDSWGLDFWTGASCPSIHLSVKHHLFPIRGGLEFLQDLTLCTDTHSSSEGQFRLLCFQRNWGKKTHSDTWRIKESLS